MLYINLTPYTMREVMRYYDRDYFSLDGYEALINFYNDNEIDYNLDPVELTIKWNEYTLGDGCLYQDYGRFINDLPIGESISDRERDTLTSYALEETTVVIRLPNKNVLILE